MKQVNPQKEIVFRTKLRRHLGRSVNVIMQQLRKIFNWLTANVILTVIMIVISFFLFRVSDNNLRLEKYRQTLELCQNFDDWYRYSKEARTDTLSKVFKMWEKSAPQDFGWLKLSENERLEILKQSTAVNRVFHYFEEAKMLSKKELLDEEYFYNFFYNLFARLENTRSPSVYQYIEAMRKKGGDNEIWNGYYYCRDIMKEIRPQMVTKK